MTVEQNKATLKHITEHVWNKGDISTLPLHVSPNWTYHGPFGDYAGPEGFKSMVTMFRNTFPDCRFVIDEAVGEGDRLAVRYTITGTMKGELMGIPPTDKSFTITAAYFYGFEDGKEASVLPFADPQQMFQQLGITLPGK